MSRPIRSFTKRTGADVVVLAGTANQLLAQRVADELGVKLGRLDVRRFADGELNIRIDEPVQGRDVYVVQPTSRPANDNLMELLLVIDGLRRADAGRITAVIPYFGYQRQEKQMQPQDPISAKLVARTIEMAGADRVMIVDVHTKALQGFFDVPVELLTALEPLAAHVKLTHSTAGFVVVSPDLGGVVRARAMAELLDAPLAIIDKRRPAPDAVEVTAIVGDVEGRHCLIVDDLTSTGSTLMNGAAALKTRGATTVTVAVTHGVFAAGALAALQASAIDEILVTDTVALPGAQSSFDDNARLNCPKLTVVSVAPMIAGAIARAHGRTQPAAPTRGAIGS